MDRHIPRSGVVVGDDPDGAPAHRHRLDQRRRIALAVRQHVQRGAEVGQVGGQVALAGRHGGDRGPARCDRVAQHPSAGGTAATGLLQAVEILRELNATGARKVPAGAPTGFVPARWRGYLDTAAKSGDTTGYRHYWELCVLLALRDGLRTGDVHVPGSRRYCDPAEYLLTPSKWADHRVEFCRLVGKPADARTSLAQVTDELNAALGELESTLTTGDGPVRLDDDGDLVISPLRARVESS